MLRLAIAFITPHLCAHNNMVTSAIQPAPLLTRHGPTSPHLLQLTAEGVISLKLRIPFPSGAITAGDSPVISSFISALGEILFAERA